MTDMIFWINVNSLIKEQQMTQEIICNQIGISLNTLRGWVSKGVLPRADEAVKLAKALNTTVEYLVTGRQSCAAETELKELKHKLLDFAQSVQ